MINIRTLGANYIRREMELVKSNEIGGDGGAGGAGWEGRSESESFFHLRWR